MFKFATQYFYIIMLLFFYWYLPVLFKYMLVYDHNKTLIESFPQELLHPSWLFTIVCEEKVQLLPIPDVHFWLLLQITQWIQQWTSHIFPPLIKTLGDHEISH